MSVATSNMGATISKSRQLGYWIATIAVAALFAAPGAALIARAPHFTEDMAHLGYPEYFLTILGVWKVLGAAIILAPRLPRLKEWAYAGMIFDATCAALSRGAMGDGVVKIALPVVIAVIVMASWTWRPPTRRL